MMPKRTITDKQIRQMATLLKHPKNQPRPTYTQVARKMNLAPSVVSNYVHMYGLVPIWER